LGSTSVLGASGGSDVTASPSLPVPVVNRPPCPGPSTHVVEPVRLGATRDGLPILAAVNGLAAATLRVRLTTAPGTRIDRAWLVVAVPGSTMAAGDNLKAFPATAWVRPENQAADVAITPDHVSAVAFSPATSGRFKVFADV
jgi:hypothetical protein